MTTSGDFDFNPPDPTKYYNTTMNVNSQWTMNFKGAADAGSFRLHPGPPGAPETLDWSIAIIGEQVSPPLSRNHHLHLLLAASS